MFLDCNFLSEFHNAFLGKTRTLDENQGHEELQKEVMPFPFSQC
jgi:hypothetical protein